ncbi:MAG: YihY/virulence factor BrkB family protein [Rhodoplanes sp.]
MDSRNTWRRRVLPFCALGLSAALMAAGFRRGADGEAGEADRHEQSRLDEFKGKTAADAPVRGWWSVLKRSYVRFMRDRVTTVAGGVTFFSLVAIFPAIAALVSIYGLFSDPAELSGQIQRLRDVLPGGAVQIVSDQMHRVAAQGRSALGTTFLISLAISLWSANSGMKALFDALNIVYDVEERRSFIRLNAVSLLFTLGAIGFILLSVVALVVLPVVFSFVGLGSEFGAAFSYGRWPLLLIVLILALALIYRFGPNRKHAKWRWITWGSASAAFFWLIASLLFTWYAANFGSFNKTYGALGAAIGFMMWMWVSAIVILAGAQLDAELECQDPSSRKFSRGKPSTES